MTRSALLVMDLQEGVLDRLAASGADVDAVVAAASRAVDAARTHDVPVYFVRVAFRAGYPEVHPGGGFAANVSSAGDRMTEAHPATQLTALEPHADEPVVVKRRISAFSGSDLDVLLRAGRIDGLVLAGVSTSGVVLSTLRQAADLDFRLTVLADACADADPEVHRVLTEKVFPRQAAVTPVDDWIDSLG